MPRQQQERPPAPIRDPSEDRQEDRDKKDEGPSEDQTYDEHEDPVKRKTDDVQ